MDGTNPLGTGTMNHAGAAAFSTAKLATGSHPIVAVYSGDAGDIGSKSAVLTVKVTSQ